MNSRIAIVVCAVALALAAFVVPSISNAEGDAKDPMVCVSQLKMGRSVIGVLGQPLGSKLIIEGEQPSRPIKISNPLSISKVDDVALPGEILLEIKGSVRISPGMHYKLEGYESGAFEGTPGWVPPPVPALAFQFCSFFMVTRVIEPANGEKELLEPQTK